MEEDTPPTSAGANDIMTGLLCAPVQSARPWENCQIKPPGHGGQSKSPQTDVQTWAMKIMGQVRADDTVQRPECKTNSVGNYPNGQ